MKRAPRTAAVVVGLLALFVMAPRILGGGEAITSAAPDFSLEVDTEPAANTGDSLGPTDSCRQVNVGRSFQVDLVAKDAPPLFGVEVSFLYAPEILRISAIQVDSGLFLGKKQGSSLFNLSEATPDEDGSYRAFAADLSITGPSGNGTVFRLTLEAKATGTSPFEIASDDPETFFNEGPIVPDTEGASLTPLLAGAEIRVDTQEPCPGSGPPPTPTEEPPPAPTPPEKPPSAPTPTTTPDETGETPQDTDDTSGMTPTPETELLEDVGSEDSELVVEDATVFQPGDVIQLEDEKLQVISVSDDVLQVERGVEGTEAAEHSGGVTVSKVGDQNQATDDEAETPEEPVTAVGGTGTDGSSGTDLTGMPWVAVWATLGGLAVAGSGGALIRLRLRRTR